MEQELFDTHAPLIVLDSVSSTNEELMVRARAGVPHGTALRARVQTAGRGRRTHSWASPDGGLYLSILARPSVAPAQMPGLPVACGIAVADALEALGCAGVRLKWPNDVITPAGKLGGILVEASQTDDGYAAVCGIGINYSLPDAGARAAGALPITCLNDALRDGQSVPAIDHLARAIQESVLEVLDAWTDGLDHAGTQAPPLYGILDVYNKLLAYNGDKVKVFSSRGELLSSGILRGIDPWGRALVEDDEGTLDALDATQVSLRPFTCE